MEANPELMLIGALLSSPSVAYHAALEEGVSDKTFSDQAVSLLWQKASGIIRRTGSLDRYAMLTELRGREDAQLLVDSIPHDISGDTAKVHAKAIRDAEKERSLRSLLVRYSRIADEIDVHITDFASDLMALLSASKSHRIRRIDEIAPDVIRELQSIADGDKGNELGIDSFINTVNRWAIPYPRGKVTVFAGYRNTGKSTHLKQEAIDMARRGIPVGIISMEDTERDIVTNTVTTAGAGFMWKYQRGIGDMAKFKATLSEIERLPIFIIDQPQTIEELEASLTILVAKHGCRMVFIDHLHEIHGGRYHSIDDRFTEYMSRICDQIKRLDISCCLYAQFSRDCEREGRPPRMSDLKGSSAIEQKARRIYMLYQDGEKTEDAGEPRFIIEGSKISNSGWGSKEDRKVTLKYATAHDGFEVFE